MTFHLFILEEGFINYYDFAIFKLIEQPFVSPNLSITKSANSWELSSPIHKETSWPILLWNRWFLDNVLLFKVVLKWSFSKLPAFHLKVQFSLFRSTFLLSLLISISRNMMSFILGSYLKKDCAWEEDLILKSLI